MNHKAVPTLEENGWELESAEERKAQHASFDMPSLEERLSLQAGRRVKLLFLFNTEQDGSPIIGCERMWVTIGSVAERYYVGCLENLPTLSDAIAPGDQITFGPEHVAAIMIPKTDPRHPEYKRNT